jgi:hypothetical protein
MNLSKFNTTVLANKGVEVELKDLKTGAGAGAYITILGTDSETYQALKEERAREAAARIESGKGNDLSRDELLRLTVETLARCTTGWRNLDAEEEDGGGALVFSHEAAVKLYTKYPAIRDQINREIADRANFVRA